MIVASRIKFLIKFVITNFYVTYIKDKNIKNSTLNIAKTFNRIGEY